MLAALAVAGRPLTEDQLAGVAGLDADAVRRGLRELTAARLLAETEPDGGHRARHALLAEAVAAGLLPGERAALHERTARALQATGEEALAAEAAEHWAAAGRVAEELAARVTAAEAAERVFGYAEAAAHWQRAIELGQASRRRRAAGIRCPSCTCGPSTRCYVSAAGRGCQRARRGGLPPVRRPPGPRHQRDHHERAARFRGLAAAYLGGGALPSVELITEALRLFEQAPPSAEHAEALFYYGHFLFVGQGQVETASTRSTGGWKSPRRPARRR